MNTILLIIKNLVFNIELEYTDTELTNIALIAAMFVQKDFNFDSTYTINLIEETISPEPDTDTDFCLAVAMKSAILLVTGELRNYVTNAVNVKDGPSTIDLVSRVDKIKAYLDILQSDYSKMRLSNSLGQGIGSAVITPTLNPNIFPDRFN